MTTFESTREIPAPPADVFAAFSDPERLARWWGPAGFTNTFDVCEFKPGGRWSFTMHPSRGETIVPWVQVFEKAEVGNRIKHIVAPANEQNLDRLTAEVQRGRRN